MRNVMPSKPKAKVKRVGKSHAKQDIVLAALLGLVVTVAGVAIVRYSGASNASFRRDPVKQMAGGKVVRKTLNTLVRVAASPQPGVDPVYTVVSKVEMENTAKVCVQYKVLQSGTWMNMAYYNAQKEGLATSTGETHDPGLYTTCLERGSQAVDGTVNINVTPGSAEILKFYGVYRAADD